MNSDKNEKDDLKNGKNSKNSKKNSSKTNLKNVRVKSVNKVKSNDLDVKKNVDSVSDNNIDIEDNSNGSSKGVTKFTFNILEVIIIMVITTLFGLLLGGLIAYVRMDSREVSCSAIRKDMVEFAGVYDDLLNEYYSDIDKDELMEQAIIGMLNYLKDPYSGYLSKENSKLLKENLDGFFIGIGVEIVVSGDLPIVTRVYDDGPAFKAGIEAGDVLFKVDDKDLTGLSALDVSSLIKTDQRGAKINITILRNGDEKKFEIARDVIEIDSVSLSYVNEESDEKIAVISITNFAQNTFSQFKSIYEEALENGASSLIVDVRDNNGGYLSAANDIASLFLDKGAVVYQKDTKGKIEKFVSDSDREIVMDVVLLVNGSTASSSEVFVAALKENLDVSVVGVNTYGKGTVQKLHELSNGSYVKYTVQTWLTPNGNEINGIGIEPTLKVELSEDYYSNPTLSNDNQLQAAINLLLNK